MPANLNALIRYKTINSCLYGGRRKYDIDELIDACSAALSEARGRTTKISERTIRDDIHVMRSEILGFNSPIEQKDGLYYYTDPKYTVLSVNITDPGILDMIIKSLLRISNDVKHPGLEIILKKLRDLSPLSFEAEIIEETTLFDMAQDERSEFSVTKNKKQLLSKMFEADTESSDTLMSFSLEERIHFSWGDVFRALPQRR